MRLPTTVVCSECRKTVRAEQARRRVTGWARMGRGGTLSGVKLLVAEDIFLCDPCILMAEVGAIPGQRKLA